MNKFNAGILIVDDHNIVRDGIRIILNHLGYTNLFFAKNSEEAFKILKNQKDNIKIISTDINRPTNNGFDFIKEISSKHNYIIGILILTSVSDISRYIDNFKQFKNGLNPTNIVKVDYLTKDIDTSIIEKSLENSLQKVTEERIRQNRLNKNEKIGLSVENNKIKILGFTGDTNLQFFDKNGLEHKLIHTYSLESSRIKQSIEELEYLINKRGVKELELQDFFNRNQDFLISDDYRKIHPHITMKNQNGKKFIPDYILEPVNQQNLSDILDLKLPQKNIFVSKSRPRYSAAILEVCSQLREYQAFFEIPENRKKIQQEYGLELYNPNLIAVIGRRKIIDPILIKHIQKDIPQITVKTYDDIIEKMKFKIK